jgi:hypothetical protein
VESGGRGVLGRPIKSGDDSGGCGNTMVSIPQQNTPSS